MVRTKAIVSIILFKAASFIENVIAIKCQFYNNYFNRLNFILKI